MGGYSKAIVAYLAGYSQKNRPIWAVWAGFSQSVIVFLWSSKDGHGEGNIWQFSGLLFVPILEVVVPYFLQFLERFLFVKTVCACVEPVYMSKNAFKFPDFFLSDVVPHFINREMGP